MSLLLHQVHLVATRSNAPGFPARQSTGARARIGVGEQHGIRQMLAQKVGLAVSVYLDIFNVFLVLPRLFDAAGRED
jgi:hypothetical protein